MKRLLLLIIFSCLLQAEINAFIDPLLYRRDLLIFLDWETENIGRALRGNLIGPISNDLIESIYHASSPILLSTPLWLNLVEQAQLAEDLLTYNKNKLWDKYDKVLYQYNILAESYFFTTWSRVETLIELMKLAYQTYQKMNQDIAILKNKGFNEHQIIDDIIANEKTYPSWKYIDKLKKGYYHDWRIVKSLLVCKLTLEKFRSEQWELRTLNPYLYLFVPRSYIDSKVEQVQNARARVENEGTRFTKEELILGFKINSLPVLTEPFNIDKLYQDIYGDRTRSALKSVNIEMGSRSFITLLSKALLQPKEYPLLITKENDWDPDKITWNIFGDGHGSSDLRAEQKKVWVMGLLDPYFTNFLYFMKNEINMNFFFYTTCFAAGHRLRVQYDEFLEPEKRIIAGREVISVRPIKFPIAVGAITHAATCSEAPEFFIPPLSIEIEKEQLKSPAERERKKKIFSSAINLEQTRIEPSFATDYGKFFKLLNEERNSYAGILDLASNIYKKFSGVEGLKIVNIPYIRFPESPWFSVVDLQEKAAHLTVTNVAVHEAENTPIIIRNKKVMFLHAHKEVDVPIGKAHGEIMVPLIIRDRMPTVVSLVAGDAQHYVQEIDARYAPLEEVFSQLSGVGSMAYDRTFYVKKLICENKLNAVAKDMLKADDRPILELQDVVLSVRKERGEEEGIAAVLPPVSLRFTYKGQRYAIDAESIEKFKKVLRHFRIEAKFLGTRFLARFAGEVKRMLTQYLKKTQEKPPSYPYPLRTISELAKIPPAAKEIAQYPQLIKHYETIKNDPEKVEKWLAGLSIGPREAIKNYIAEMEQLAYLQRSLTLLSANLALLNRTLKD